MEKIHLIAPYAELADLALQVSSELKLGLVVKLGNLEEAVKPALESQKSGALAVISRGGTASIIKNHLEIPVIEIKVSGYDLLKILSPYQNTDGIIGIVGYRNVIEGCMTVNTALKIRSREIIIPNTGDADWDDIRRKINDMVDTYRISTIIGDTVVASKFREVHTDFRLITSGRESLIQAVDEAKNIIDANMKEKEKTERFKAILNLVHDGVIATDDRGIITVANPNAEKILGTTQENLTGKEISKIVKNTSFEKVLKSGHSEIDQIQTTPSGQVLSSRIPIIVDSEIKGMVAIFQKTSIIQDREIKIRQNLYSKGLVTKYTFDDIITKNEKMKKMISLAERYAATNATILVSGESGTGKELLVQSMHAASPRLKGPFVAVNCATLPAPLLESELFGYVEGAFTGAARGGKTGLFELSHNGTIFLDEISELDKPLQARLLRVLQEKQVMKLGSDKIIPVNIRVIAATNSDLKKLVREGAFREDLFYRLNILTIKTIPLRERTDDIMFLCDHFRKLYNAEYGKKVSNFSSKVADYLTNHIWPGNVRELKNIIERLVISANNDTIDCSDIETVFDNTCELAPMNYESNDDLLSGSMEEIKIKIIKKVLEEENFNKTKTAKRLNIDRTTINRLL